MLELASNHEVSRRTLYIRIGALKVTRRVRQQAFDHFNTLKLAQKVRVPQIAAKLAIGDAVHPDIFLNSDNIADAAIFDFAQLRRIDLAVLILFPGLPKLGWPQQTTDMIRAKRGLLYRLHNYPLACTVWAICSNQFEVFQLVSYLHPM